MKSSIPFQLCSNILNIHDIKYRKGDLKNNINDEEVIERDYLFSPQKNFITPEESSKFIRDIKIVRNILYQYNLKTMLLEYDSIETIPHSVINSNPIMLIEKDKDDLLNELNESDRVESIEWVVVSEITQQHISIIHPTNGLQKFERKKIEERFKGFLVKTEVVERNKEQNSLRRKEKVFLKNLFISIIVIAIGIRLIWSLATLSDSPFLLIFELIISLIGIYCAYELLNVELSNSSDFLKRFCTSRKAFNCKNVVTSKASKVLYGLFSMSDLGMIYFLTKILALCISTLTVYNQIDIFHALSLLSYLALPYTVFSVLYQGVILKQFCPLCLLVQGLLWLDAIVFFLSGYANPTLESIILNVLLLSLVIACILQLIFSKSQRGQKKNINISRELNGLRRSWDLLNNLSKTISAPDFLSYPEPLFFGKKGGLVQINAVLNPSCEGCGNLFNYLKRIVSFHDDLGVSLFLIEASERSPINKDLFIKRKLKGDEYAVEKLSEWFSLISKSNSDSLYKLYKLWNPENDLNSVDLGNYKKQQLWFSKYTFDNFPTIFINEIYFPFTYPIELISYFYQDYLDEVTQ